MENRIFWLQILKAYHIVVCFSYTNWMKVLKTISDQPFVSFFLQKTEIYYWLFIWSPFRSVWNRIQCMHAKLLLNYFLNSVLKTSGTYLISWGRKEKMRVHRKWAELQNGIYVDTNALSLTSNSLAEQKCNRTNYPNYWYRLNWPIQPEPEFWDLTSFMILQTQLPSHRICQVKNTHNRLIRSIIPNSLRKLYKSPIAISYWVSWDLNFKVFYWSYSFWYLSANTTESCYSVCIICDRK